MKYVRNVYCLFVCCANFFFSVFFILSVLTSKSCFRCVYKFLIKARVVKRANFIYYCHAHWLVLFEWLIYPSNQVFRFVYKILIFWIVLNVLIEGFSIKFIVVAITNVTFWNLYISHSPPNIAIDFLCVLFSFQKEMTLTLVSHSQNAFNVHRTRVGWVWFTVSVIF